jgi:hypothetical protein
MQMVAIGTRKLAIGGIVAGVTLVCFVARLSLAQKPADPPARSVPEDASTPTIEDPKTEPPQASVPSAKQKLPPSEPPSPLPAEPAADLVKDSASVAAPGSAPIADDPEKVAKDFVEQNQKQAEAQLKNLKDEAEKLRARLQKVEAGIKRWETLLGALKQSQTATRIETPQSPDTAVDLRPVDPGDAKARDSVGGPAVKAGTESAAPAPGALETPGSRP